MFQVCMKKWLQEFLLLLHLTGDSNFRSHQNPSPWKIIVLEVCLCNLCGQLWWQARQADAACLDDTTFTPLTGFYMSSPETAATCWLETASIEPSHCWVSLPDDGLWYKMYQLILSVTGCRHAVRLILGGNTACMFSGGIYLKFYSFLLPLPLRIADVWLNL